MPLVRKLFLTMVQQPLRSKEMQDLLIDTAAAARPPFEELGAFAT